MQPRTNSGCSESATQRFTGASSEGEGTDIIGKLLARNPKGVALVLIASLKLAVYAPSWKWPLATRGELCCREPNPLLLLNVHEVTYGGAERKCVGGLCPKMRGAEAVSCRPCLPQVPALASFTPVHGISRLS
jgi:hypothetical protein